MTDFSFKVKQTNADNETFVYSANIGKINAPTIRMYIFSPLYPVHSTISILKNQLIYITVIALVLAVLISFYLSSMISNPIRNIRDPRVNWHRVNTASYSKVEDTPKFQILRKLLHAHQ